MTKPLAPTLTSYDFLKTAALVLMILDHVGYFFFPEQDAWRAAGRLSAPIWLFLVGYARSRDVSLRMWVGMGVLLVSNYVFGMPILPVNILGTIIVCRLALDPLMAFIRRHPQMLYPVLALLFVGGLVTFMMVEYGSTAMMMVLTGYIVRNREEMGLCKNQVLQFAGVAALLYAFMQCFIYFAFPQTLTFAVIGALLVLMLSLTRFRLHEYPALTDRLGPFSGLIRVCGRQTFEIYVLHLLLFKIMAHVLDTQSWELFSFHILQ
jgi:hypothetical protein